MMESIEGKKLSEAAKMYADQVAVAVSIFTASSNGSIGSMSKSELDEAIEDMKVIKQNGKALFRTVENRLAFSESIITDKLEQVKSAGDNLEEVYT